MSKTFFITGSGTGVGKTLVTATLAHQLLVQGKRVSALKPIITGFEEGAPSDASELLKSQNLPATVPNIAAISPWCFKAPLAPSIAAKLEGRDVAISDVVNFCTVRRVSEVTLIEGAGGVMAPINDTQTMLDWMLALDAPAILVVGTYLGAISHALTASEMLRLRGITLQAVVVSESEDGAMSVENTASMLRPFIPQARYIVPLPRVAGEGDLWHHAADLTWMLT